MTETLCTYYRKKCAIQELVNLQNVYASKWEHEHVFHLMSIFRDGDFYECLECGAKITKFPGGTWFLDRKLKPDIIMHVTEQFEFHKFNG